MVRKPKPEIQYPTGTLVRILKTAIGINDLNILDSSISVVSEGKIIGHEGVGIIEEVGSEVSNFKKDYCVLISSVTSCGNCENCKKLMYSHRATHIVNICHEFAVKSVMDLTDGKGVYTVIEAAGTSSTFEIAREIVALGGHVANIGTHGKGVNLHLDKLFSRNITVTTYEVDTKSILFLIEKVGKGELDPSKLVSHLFKLDQIIKAYEVFENAKHEKVLKTVLTA